MRRFQTGHVNHVPTGNDRHSAIKSISPTYLQLVIHGARRLAEVECEFLIDIIR